MSAARTERLMNLLALLLNARRPIALAQIQALEEFAAYRAQDPKSGERAFERDKAALIASGVPLRWVAPQDDEADRAGGYSIDTAHYYLQEVHLSPQQRALLSIAGAAAAALAGYSGRSAVRRALAKLGFDADTAPRTPHSALAHAPLALGTHLQRLAEHLDMLHRALVHLRQVKMRYPSSDGVDAPVLAVRRVDPYGLYFRQGVWYLVGFCHLRAARRTFHLGRTAHIEMCSPPQAFVYPADFDIQQAARLRPWQYPKAPPVDAYVRLAERVVPAVTEIFGAGVRLGRDAVGPYIHAKVASSDAFLAAIMPLGEAAEVVSPPSLRALVAQSFADLAARYAAVGLSK